MKQPTTSAQVRAFLANRATARPTNSEPTVAIAGTTATIRLYDPIDNFGAPVERMWIDGREVDLDDRQKRLWEKYKKKP